MENFIVSARKYRPSRFEDVIGQPQVTNTLKNALRTNQVAQSFLFCGPRGVGKTTCARILAKAVNCENLTKDFEPCNECASCQAFNENASFNVFELDAASNNSVEDIRALIEQVRFAPQAGKKKIYIIDEVHMLSTNAFNAFLKTLEEPPSYALFILATTEKHKIIPTILSRCQIFDFNRIKTEDMVKHLIMIAKKEKIEAEEDALHIIAQKADGALRDALSMFDRISIFSGGKIRYTDVVENLNILDYDYFFRLTDYFLAADAASALLTFNQILQKGFDGENFLSGLADHFRELLVAKDEVTHVLLDFSENIRKRYVEQSQYTAASFLISALSILNDAEQQYRLSKNKRLTVELALIKLSHLQNAINLSKQLSGLKKKSLTGDDMPLSLVKEDVKDLPLQRAPGGEKKTESPSQPKDSPASKGVRSDKPKTNGDPIRLTSLENLNKEFLETKKETEAEKEEIIFEAIDHFAFQQVWKSYIATVVTDRKTYLLKILEVFPPEIVENKMILLRVGNDSHLHALNQEREAMYYFLKKELDKKAIDLRIEVDKSKLKNENGRKPYTAREKYENMLERNPKLKDLKERLKLELDF
ncbi:MAG TPA: DNA polymerase III subunit gamma/tau [Chitinophagales bacterium]|nr:DNA polymerase III subunit gamma/tau [Chitinophagales bacterium]